jgi:hypothetical protein
VGDRASILMGTIVSDNLHVSTHKYSVPNGSPEASRHSWASDARSFTSGATPDDVLREVEEYEKVNRDTSSRRYIRRFSVLIQNFEGFFSAVDTFVSCNPQTAALIWGGLRFVIQVHEAQRIGWYLLFPNPSYR